MKADTNIELALSSRRNFLKNSGALLVGFHLFSIPIASSLAISKPNQGALLNSVDSWIKIAADGSIKVITGKMELGQGIKTALMQMAAEELDCNFSRMQIQIADTALTPDERYTAGSASIESSGRSIRYAAATAKAYLLQLQAKKIGADFSKLQVDDGNILLGNERVGSYWELLGDELMEIEVDFRIKLKDHQKFNVVGKPVLRDDILKMLKAEPHFIHDLRLPNMLHARVLKPPVYGAKLLEIPAQEAEALEGVLKVLRAESFVGVLATDEFACIQALQLLQAGAKWESKPITIKPDDLQNDILKQSGTGQVVSQSGASADLRFGFPGSISAEYFKPYTMHASLGPSCAIAQFMDGNLQVWSHTQGPFPLRRTLANLLGMDELKIHVLGVPGSGCYGHNGADDVAAEAAFLAKMYPGKPIRLQWMREDEHRCEPYGPAMLMRLSADLSADGKIRQWFTELYSDTHSTRPSGNAAQFQISASLKDGAVSRGGGFSGGSSRNADPLYDIPFKRIVGHSYDGPLRTSALRGLGAYANIFALESFMDELALEAKADPFKFRIDHLKNERAIRVLEKLEEESKAFRSDKLNNLGWGIAFSQYKNSAAYFGIWVQVEVDLPQKVIKLKRMIGVIDAGQAINPDGLINQTEGGMIQAASWTLLEAVRFNENGPLSGSWNTYPIIRFDNVPEIEVFVIDRPDQPPLGAGEAAQGPTSAAIANAVFQASSQRIRSLPLKLNY
jgi:nicotinate dehydrogenase subunit B